MPHPFYISGLWACYTAVHIVVGMTTEEKTRQRYFSKNGMLGPVRASFGLRRRGGKTYNELLALTKG